MRTTVPDEPGTLAALCSAFARERIDIVSLQTFPLGLRPGQTPAPVEGADDGAAPGNRAHTTTDTVTRTGTESGTDTGTGSSGPEVITAEAALTGEQVMDEFVLRAPEDLEADALVRIVHDAGAGGTWVERADAHDLVDTPTRVLRLAARTALDTAELPLALRQLLGRCTVRSIPPVSPYSGLPSPLDVPPEGTCDETVLHLPDPAGGVIVVERPRLPFTPAEFARASALVELDRVLGAGARVPRSPDTLTLPDGLPVTVRRADTRDLRAALEMHRRCSERTLRQRYHGPVGEADRYLRHLLSPRFGRTLAARTASGKLVALGHLLWDGDETEVALIVEDDWQHRGIGTELLRRLAGLAREAGSREVYAVTQASNTAMVAAMRKLGTPLDHQVEDRTLVITARLTGGGQPSAADGARTSATASGVPSRSRRPG
ncbi:GNAT family N-acetyltransferase [Streptomyces sp. M600PL45_2]|uniref:GNAT family N-acetyltransferase n=2 Tax=Streptomyces marispadix TaxID=2922868 RepID=A0ABS9SRN9_9ACTN|nr:GNAT family N-acetyltransferase [Streptomyces marispadix]MCH6158950.1 GNAT family N-acetyltransferase [Streptomyces marispadix]